MPDDALVLALDQGSHASRAVLFDATGAEVAQARQPVGTRRQGGDVVDQDPQELLVSLQTAPWTPANRRRRRAARSWRRGSRPSARRCCAGSAAPAARSPTRSPGRIVATPPGSPTCIRTRRRSARSRGCRCHPITAPASCAGASTTSRPCAAPPPTGSSPPGPCRVSWSRGSCRACPAWWTPRTRRARCCTTRRCSTGRTPCSPVRDRAETPADLRGDAARLRPAAGGCAGGCAHDLHR